MRGFVDPTDPVEVEEVLASAVPGFGLQGVLDQLAAVPGLPIRPGRPGGLLRRPEPATIDVDDRRLSITDEGRATLQHIVGGVVLATDRVAPRDLPGMLAAMLTRAVAQLTSADQLSVILTSMRDALV